MRTARLVALLIVFLLVSGVEAFAVEQESAVLRIYIDADRTGARESGQAIERGVRTALDEVGWAIDGRKVDLAALDHRGNSVRSRVNLEKILKDPNTLAVFSGLHSPPLLANRDFINQNRLLVLDPWAAAGPITRPSSGENWIFRLSVDDSKAGKVISTYAVKVRKFKRPHLLLEKTGWGRSNLNTMTTSLKDMGYKTPPVTWFDWGVSEAGARVMLRDIAYSDADVIFLVANAPEGKTFFKAMLALDQGDRLPVISHWGITGGDFPKVIDAGMREKFDLMFIQTNFSFLHPKNGAVAEEVLKRAIRLFPEVKGPKDIKAPAGFIHAYDLTKMLIEAVREAGLTGNAKKDRENIRSALENLKNPIKGLIKTYVRPFSPYDGSDPDAHEALGEEDFVIAKYGPEGEIIIGQ